MTFQDVISQPPYPGAKPEEVAEIYVLGATGTAETGTGGGSGVFSDWESVWVQHRWKQGEPTFRFVASERDPVPTLWNRLQIKPKDAVIIKLGGEVAVTGVVIVRQTAYDPNSHAVSLQGKGEQWFAWRGAVMKDSPNDDGNYPGGILDVANAVLKEFGAHATPIGTIDNTPFKPPAHATPGETVWHFLERLGRDKKVILGGDYQGQFLLIGDHVSPVVDELIEGVNIISCQCVINIIDWYSKYVARGQTQRSDAGSPKDAAQQEKKVDSPFFQKRSPLLVALEHPVWTAEEVMNRAVFEARTGEGTIIEVTVVLYGWFTSKGKLWAHCVGEDVIFTSPMTTLVGERLAIKTVTCTQDRQGGTKTSLELIAPWYLMESGIRAGSTGKSQVPTDPAQNVTGLPGSPSGPSLTPDQRKAGGTR